MTDPKKPENPSTREVVETVIDLIKLDRSVSWDRLAQGERLLPKRWQDDELSRQPARARKREKKPVTGALPT